MRVSKNFSVPCVVSTDSRQYDSRAFFDNCRSIVRSVRLLFYAPGSFYLFNFASISGTRDRAFESDFFQAFRVGMKNGLPIVRDSLRYYLKNVRMIRIFEMFRSGKQSHAVSSSIYLYIYGLTVEHEDLDNVKFFDKRKIIIKWSYKAEKTDRSDHLCKCLKSLKIIIST